MPPLTDGPATEPFAAAVVLDGPTAALALAAALLFTEPAGVVTLPVVLTPVPGEVPAAPVVAPAPMPPPAVPPMPAADAGRVVRRAPHSSAQTGIVLKVLFIACSWAWRSPLRA